MNVTVIWAGIIALGLFMYVVLDGFDLGIGILFPLFPDARERDLMMNTVAPVWDGNETWLVLGGAGLFAVFPVVYSTVLSALYLPLIFMLVCLIFRGVSFEIRAKANRTKPMWDLAFIGGSTGAAFFQGVALGAFLQGIPMADGRFAGGAFEWLTPFAVFTGLGLAATYALLGCCWLVAKTEGDLQRRLHRLAWPLTVVLLGFIAAISVWTPLQDPHIAQRWFDTAWLYRLLPAPLLVAVCAGAMYRALRGRHHITPFALALGIVLLGYAGLLASLWPFAIPASLTLWEAAAPRSSQMFTLVGAAVILPVILGYTTMGYWVFRGKVRHDDQHHYH